MTLTEKSGHLAWCALVALALARQDGGALSGTGKPLSHPMAVDRAEATPIFARGDAGHRVASEAGAPAGRQREAGQQAELPLAFLHRRVD